MTTVLEAIESAKKVKHKDPHLANYILRDYQVLKDAKLDDLAWIMHQQGCFEGDVDFLIECLEEYLRSINNNL